MAVHTGTCWIWTKSKEPNMRPRLRPWLRLWDLRYTCMSMQKNLCEIILDSRSYCWLDSDWCVKLWSLLLASNTISIVNTSILCRIHTCCAGYFTGSGAHWQWTHISLLGIYISTFTRLNCSSSMSSLTRYYVDILHDITIYGIPSSLILIIITYCCRVIIVAL